ncbi:MAG: hypothetical protein ACRET0_05540 [Steroidobacteraceae bacterium]
MCTHRADQKSLTGAARKHYLRSCHLEVVPR